MDTAALQVSINTQAARADLNALAKAFDRVEGSFNSLDRAFAKSAGAIDRNATKTVKGFDKVARVAALLGKIKISTNSVDAIHKFTAAIDGLGRARSISDAKINNLRKFMVLASAVRAPTGMNGLVQFMNVVGNVRAPSASTNARLTEFFKAVQGFRAPSGSAGLAQLLATFATIKVPTTAQINRLRELLTVLSSARNISGANQIARDLDQIAASAGRAGAAINSMPARMRQMGTSAGVAHNNVRKMSGGVHELNNRLSLGYQVGTAFTAMFSTFTLGAFFREIWKTNIEMAKLEKAMLFATGSMEGQQQATADAIAMFQRLGMRIDVAADAYARFAISATAAGFSIQQTQQVFGAVGQALQVVGATSQQVEYAMYGLTQMMQKGKVSSEEFNRQIGEQLPGNAAVGARALSKVLGRQVEVAEFFDLMARGQIQSATFAPAWAAELDKMYAPLQELVNLRPDIALNRLKNAFTLFTVEVGKAGFMAGLGDMFGDLSGRLVDDTGQLTDRGKELAQQWGMNLAKATRTLGSVIGYLVDNLDGVLTAVKGLIALRLGATFYQWGSGAASAAKDMLSFVTNARAAATVAPAAAASRATAAATSTAAGIAATGASALYAVPAGPQQAGRGGAQAAAQARGRLTRPSMGARAGTFAGAAGMAVLTAPLKGLQALARTTASAVTTNFAKMGTAMRGLATGAGIAAVGGGVLRTALMLLGPIGLAAGVALAAFGDKAVEVGGKTTTANDMIGAGFGILKDKITDWFSNSKVMMNLFGENGQDLGRIMGSVISNLVAGFVTAGEVIGNVLLGIGNSIDLLLIGPLSGIINIFNKLRQGDFAGAFSVLTSAGSFASERIGRIGGNIAGAAGAIGNFEQTRAEVERRAVAATDARAQGDAQTQALLERNQREAQAAADRVAAQQEADRIASAQGRREAALRAISAGPFGELGTFEAVMADLDEALSTQTRATERLTSATEQNTNAAQQGGAAGGGNPLDIAMTMLKEHEGFRATAYWDVNAYRVGYGSDTITDPNTGRVRRVERGTTGVTQAMADADLRRRVETEFMPTARGNIGAGIFDALPASAQAALTSVAYNYGSVPNSVRRAAQGGDLNEIADAVAALGVHNNGINRRRRLEEASVIRSGWTGGTGQDVAGMTETEATEFEERGTRMRDTYERIVGTNPAQSAQSAYNRFIVDITQFTRDVEEARAAGAALEWVDKDLFAAAEAKLRQDVEDAINPLGKQRRADESQNQLMEARLAGARDEAGFMERVIELREQGYEFESQAGRERLETERRLYEETQRRTRLLQSQIDLAETERDLRVSSISRNGSSFDATLASIVSSRAGEGRSYDQAVADAQADGSYGNMIAEARAQENERVQASMQSAMRELAQMQADARLRGTEASRQSNYKSYLEELTGLTGRTVAEMERMEPQVAAYARHLADAKTALENPPGFQRWIDGIKPLADALEDIKVSFAEGLSDGITSALMGEDFDWGDMAKNLRRQWTKSIVDNALGSMFQRGVDRANGGAIPGMPGAPAAANDNHAGGFLSAIGSFFGLGGSTGAATDPTAAAGAGAYTINATSVVVNAQSLMGGGAPGELGQLASAITQVAGAGGASASGRPGNGLMGAALAAGDIIRSGALNTGASATGRPGNGLMGAALAAGDIIRSGALNTGSAPAASGGGAGGIMGFLGGNAGNLIGIGATLFDLLGGRNKDAAPEKQYSMGDVNGIIGAMSTNTLDYTAVAAKSNPIADVLNMALQVGGSYFGAGNYGQSYGMGKGLRDLFGSFREGGYATEPVEWSKMPHYAEGTPNTSGIAAVLHPNEAVIPLSRGRKVPVEMSGMEGGGSTTVNNSFTIVANDPNEFRQAEASIQRRQNRAAQRAKLRNLT